MKVIKTIAKNFIHLSIGQAVSGLFYFTTIVILARYLGPAGFGAFSFAEASFMFFLILINMGIDFIGIREVSRDAEGARVFAGKVIPIKFILAMFSFAILILFAYFLPKPGTIKLLLFIFGLALFPSALLVHWFFEGHQRMSISAISLVIREAVFLGGTLIVMALKLNIIYVGIVFLLSRLLSSVALVWCSKKQFGDITLSINLKEQKDIILQALPIGLALIAGWIIYYFDTALIVLLRGEVESGFFNASYKPVFFIMMASITYYRAVFPAMSICARTSREKLTGLIEGSIKLLTTIWVPVVVIGIYLARPLLIKLYGIEYADASGALRWLLLSGLIMAINGAYQQGLISSDSQRKVGITASVIIFSNIVLNFILIPIYGFIGAAIAKLSSDLIAMPFYHHLLRPKAKIKLIRSIRPHIIAGLLMAAFLFRLDLNIHLFLKLALSFIIYLLALFIFGAGNYLKEIKKYKDETC